MRAVHYLSILAIAGVFACCSKGDTGAVGPVGATGANGTQGATGPKGDTGAQGNANVVSQTFTASAWTYSNPQWYENFSVTALTSTIVSAGAVEVYLSANAGTNWTALPYTQYGSVANYVAGYTYGLNSLEVTWIYNSVGSGSDPNTYYSTSACLIKVVCIAPAIIKKYPGTDWKNSAAVAQIPEVSSVLKSMNN